MTTLPPPPPPAKKPPPPAPPPAAGEWDHYDVGPVPTKTVLNAQEGFGKTSVMAHAPKPLLIMAPQETGYITLRAADRVPSVPCKTIDTFDGLIAFLRGTDLSQFDTVCVDALSGFHRLLNDAVLTRQFAGDTVKFSMFNHGINAVSMKWLPLLSALDDVVKRCGCSVILASHAKAVKTRNPTGDDYRRWASEIYENAWDATRQWADCVFFGEFFALVDEGKAMAAEPKRIIHTEHRTGHDAKNRYGMPATIVLDGGPDAAYSQIFSHLT